MEESRIAGTPITPLYSFGAYQKPYWKPEIRTGELKGMMRYMYRIACPNAKSMLLMADESALFGGAAGGAGADSGHRSPIRLLIRNEMKAEGGIFLPHHQADPQKSIHDPTRCFKTGDFEFTLRLESNKLTGCRNFPVKVDLAWYEDLAKVGLMLCGMGRRCRKGRGCFQIDGMVFASGEEVLEWLCPRLNRIGAASSWRERCCYEKKDGQIRAAFGTGRLRRPVIQNIRTGRLIAPEHLEEYLLAVDTTCHDLLDKYKKLDEEEKKMATGYLKPRLASPLFVRLVQVEGGFVPLYVFVKGICNSKGKTYDDIDHDRKERELFLTMVEKKGEAVYRDE